MFQYWPISKGMWTPLLFWQECTTQTPFKTPFSKKKKNNNSSNFVLILSHNLTRKYYNFSTHKSSVWISYNRV